MRGKRLFKRCRCSSLWITPAGAGKTRKHRAFQRGFKDHPRRCGENLTCCISSSPCLGSPPQVRGKLVLVLAALPLLRITPAGAGKTKDEIFGDYTVEDHPRRCGENVRAELFELFYLGSPPQVRGKPRKVLRRVVGVGITPAGAGKTGGAVARPAAFWDHPRRCGEN